MKIKKATAKNIRELVELIKLSDNRTEEVAKKKVEQYIHSKKGFFIIAVKRRKIIGYLLFKIVDEDKDAAKFINVNSYSNVCWIAVHPDFRNLHIGSKLLDEAIKYSEKYNKKGLWLDCRGDVIKFYEKNGFVNVGNFPRPSSSGKIKPCYVMVKAINKAKYSFYKYNPEYPSLFEKEKAKIVNLLGKNIAIEHVGSTSIPGLGGKGIIDIAIKTPKNKIKKFTGELGGLGYKQTAGHKPTENSLFFQKIMRYHGKERRVHVHLALNNYFWNTFIAFRDYLRTHGKERNQYARIKKEAVKFANGAGRKYREYKNEFLEKLTKKALKEKK